MKVPPSLYTAPPLLFPELSEKRVLVAENVPPLYTAPPLPFDFAELPEKEQSVAVRVSLPLSR